MVGCKYEFKGIYTHFKCLLETEEQNEYCYWHQEIEGKKPTKEQLSFLKKIKF